MEAHRPIDDRGPVASVLKPVVTAEEAVLSISPGAVVLVGGWGGVGVPGELISALAGADVSSLTVVSNNCGTGHPRDIGLLFAAGKVRKAVTSFPTHPAAEPFRRALAEGGLDLELVPQGTLVERIRCGGSGLGGFFTPTSAGTPLGEGKEERVLDGRLQVFEPALRGDVALIHAWEGDEYGNLRFRYAAGAFNSTMATAADFVIAEVESLSSTPLPPDQVDTAGIFVDALVLRSGS
ncbi:MAG: CoA transferase subunit A [Acidimicrobiia bacterium]